MKIIIPELITDDTLVSSTIPETDYAEWSSLTTYARGDFVISTTSHTVYRSLTDANLDNDPDLEQIAIADPLIEDPDPVNWQVISATNRWKMFDQKPSVRAVQASEIEVVLIPDGLISGVAGFGVKASTVVVSVVYDSVEVYQNTLVMQDDTIVATWWDYFFAPISLLTEFVLVDVPPYSGAEITITLTGGGDVECGQIVVGETRTIGETVFGGTSFNGLDFSFVQQDEFGDLTTVQRAATRVSNYEVVIPSGYLLGFDNLMRSLRGGTAAVWVGLEDPKRAAVNYGFYRDYRSVYQTVDISLVNLQIQGIV